MIVYNKGDKVTPRNAIFKSPVFTVDDIQDGGMFTVEEMPGIPLYARDFDRLVNQNTTTLLTPERIRADAITAETIAAASAPEFKKGDRVVERNAAIKGLDPRYFTVSFVRGDELEFIAHPGAFFKASDFVRVDEAPPTAKNLFDTLAGQFSETITNAGIYSQVAGRAERKINGISRNDVESFKEVSLRVGVNMLDMYQVIATKSAIYPGNGTPLGLAYVALKLNGEAGEFAEHVGKAMRDDALVKPISEDGCEQLCAPSGFIAGELMPERHASLLKEAGDVLWYLSAICNELGTTLSAVARTNLEKLCDRNERNALQGSGDNR